MPLNKLENFIKNTEGRILYVNPNDLDATDGIENQGNSLTKPFKTIQRALIESARFSYLEGNDNDIVEKTTILLFPGEHLIDNRPGFGIKNVSGDARAVSPTGSISTAGATETFTLTLNSNFDLTQEDNILYKFNSVHGGVVVPRGTSIVGLDLRKTKVRPKYVPNPTDDAVPNSAVFRITGACYFWQFSIFDGEETGLVYTDNTDFGVTNQSKPTFSHHKLTVFEYADGVNTIDSFQLTDLQVYYSKLSNAFNRASTREITQKYPLNPEAFAPQRPEFEIVGAFATDDKAISRIVAGDGATAGSVVTVTTSLPHELSSGTPIKVNGVNVTDFNISTKVQTVIDDNRFTYQLPYVRPNLPAGPSAGLSGSGAFIAVETDTVTGASPYIFNCSLRSVYGMCGMHADGSKATGFKSMVVAQFTGVSLQKDDRAFAEYNPTNRSYDKISYSKQTGEKLASESSSQINETVYHLKASAVYREGWKTVHVRVSNDSVIQVVSVFAIGYHMHFLMESGGDASITNSNSNFGQFALGADGFKKNAFEKDDKGYVTNIIGPKAITADESNVEWLQLDKVRTQQIYDACSPTGTNTGGVNPDPNSNVGTSINVADFADSPKKRLYLLGQTNPSIPPSDIAQGFRIGAKFDEKLYVNEVANVATIYMSNGVLTSTETNTLNDGISSEKAYVSVLHSNSINNVNPSKYEISDAGGHQLLNGESIRIIAESGRLPEGLDPHQVYFAITKAGDSTLGSNEIRIASSRANSELATPEYIKTISDHSAGNLKIISRVSDKKPGEIGHPIQFDDTKYRSAIEDVNNGITIANGAEFKTVVGGWFVHVNFDNPINAKLIALTGTTGAFSGDEIPYFTRKSDNRSLDEKLYKIRYVVPKELVDAKDPTDGFILQESSTVNYVKDDDFEKTTVGLGNLDPSNFDAGYLLKRNPRFISFLTYDGNSKIATVRTDRPHDMKSGEQVVIRGIQSSTNPTGLFDKEYNGTFKVESVIDDKTYTYKVIKLVDGEPVGDTITVGTYVNISHTRNRSVPTFERNDNKENLFIYRTETISPYKYKVTDGIYHLYVLNGNNKMEEEFTNASYNQNIVDLYPQLDRDNPVENPQEAQSYAELAPIGQVVTNDLKKSITRETANVFMNTFGVSKKIDSVSSSATSPVISLDTEHQLNGLKHITKTDGTQSFTSTLNASAPHGADGTYHNIKLFSSSVSPASAPWKGATASITIDSQVAIAVTVTEGGSGYAAGDVLYPDSSSTTSGGIGGAPTNTSVSILTEHLAIVDDTTYVQITGITTGTDSYHRVRDTPSEKQITLYDHADNVTILPGQQVVPLGKYSTIDTLTTGTPVDNVVTTTVTTTSPHGLLRGNAICILDTADKKVGDFIVNEVTPNSNEFKIVTTGVTLTNPQYILKHGLSASDAISGKAGENLGVRGATLYGGDTLVLGESIDTDQSFIVKLSNGNGARGTVTGTYDATNGSPVPTGTSAITINSAGNGYDSTNPPTVSIKGSGTGATATATVTAGKITGINVTAGGSGYTSTPTVSFIDSGITLSTGSANEKIAKRSSVESRFPVGTYIQIGSEILRITATSLTGTNEDKISVIRGALGTNIADHNSGVLINKIKPLAMEVRRPSILRASGHTFEYLGYGPGNYSTGLPQITKRTLTEREEFLSQSQETSCGTVVYTGMNDKGDFYIGNTKISADSGEQVTFDIPIPTVTGEDPSKLSVVFDEVIVKERLLVEGGASKQILSQFDGPVTFNAAVRFNADLNLTKKLSVKDTATFLKDTEATLDCSTKSQNGGVIVKGGVSILKNLLTCEQIRTYYDQDSTSSSVGSIVTAGGVGIGKALFVGTTLNVAGTTNLNGDVNLGDDVNTDEVSFNSKVNTNLLPSTNGSKTLGNSGNKWGNLFASAATLDSVNVVGNQASISKTTGALIVAGGVGISGDLNVGGDITAYASSDGRLKDNPVQIENPLEKVCQLSGYTFTWNNQSTKNGEQDTGVIAQEVMALGLPGVTSTRDDGTFAVNYEKLVPLLIEAIKDLAVKLDNKVDK